MSWAEERMGDYMNKIADQSANRLRYALRDLQRTYNSMVDDGSGKRDEVAEAISWLGLRTVRKTRTVVTGRYYAYYTKMRYANLYNWIFITAQSPTTSQCPPLSGPIRLILFCSFILFSTFQVPFLERPVNF